MYNNLKLAICVIIMLATISQITTDIYMPSLPAMAVYFNRSINELQLTIPLFTIGFSIGTLLYGPLSDNYGRKPLILAALIIGLIGSICCLCAVNYLMLMSGRFIQGLGLSGAGVLSRAVTRDASANLIQMLKLNSIINILYTLATAIAPLLGGYIEKYFFWRVDFIVLSGYILLILILITFFFYESSSHHKKTTVSIQFKETIKVCSSKNFISSAITASLGLAGLICYQTLAPFLLESKAHLTSAEYGYACLITTLPLLIGSYLNNKLANKLSPQILISFGLFCYLCCGVIYILAGLLNIYTPLLVIIPFLIFSLGCSFILPACSANAMMLFKENIGIASSIYSCLQMICASISSYLISLIKQPDLFDLGLYFILISLLSTILVKIQRHYTT